MVTSIITSGCIVLFLFFSPSVEMCYGVFSVSGINRCDLRPFNATVAVSVRDQKNPSAGGNLKENHLFQVLRHGGEAEMCRTVP